MHKLLLLLFLLCEFHRMKAENVYKTYDIKASSQVCTLVS